MKGSDWQNSQISSFYCKNVTFNKDSFRTQSIDIFHMFTCAYYKQFVNLFLI